MHQRIGESHSAIPRAVDAIGRPAVSRLLETSLLTGSPCWLLDVKGAAGFRALCSTRIGVSNLLQSPGGLGYLIGPGSSTSTQMTNNVESHLSLTIWYLVTASRSKLR